MFEQIKHCRYIRHYHPHGSESEEEETSSDTHLPKIANTKLTFVAFEDK